MHEQARLYEDAADGPAEPNERVRPDEETLVFEEAFARLERIVARLEGGESALEDSLRLFEEGVRLARLCRSRLDRAEQRIRVLVDGHEGEDATQIAADLEREIRLGAEGSIG